MESIEIIKQIQSFFNSLGIDWIVVLLYICSGFLVSAFIPKEIKIPFTKKFVTDAWKVLIVGSAVVAVYVFIEYKYPTEFTRETLKRLFVSYIFTTSMYEIALKDTIGARIVSLLQKLKPEQK